MSMAERGQTHENTPDNPINPDPVYCHPADIRHGRSAKRNQLVQRIVRVRKNMDKYMLIDEDREITKDEMFQDWMLTNQADYSSFETFIQDLLDSHIIR
jgi:hypothetical protein